MTTTNDPIADMLTRIRNANTSKHDTVDIPASKMKLSIADILVDEGYIAKYDLTGEGVNKNIHVTLKYGADKNEKIISDPAAPFAQVSGATNEAMEFIVRAWCYTPDYWDAYFGLIQQIVEALGEAGVQAPAVRVVTDAPKA